VSEQFIEEVTVGAKTLRLTHEDIPLDKIELDDDNPRIRYRLKAEMNGKAASLDEAIMSMNGVAALQRDIELNEGLQEKIIVQRNGNGKFKTIEGNCRLVCIRRLHKKHPHDPRWKTVPARIVPSDVEPRQIAILLTGWHIAGKIQWKAHEKAGQVYHMIETLKMDTLEVATYLHTSKSTVIRLLHAYKMMFELFLKIDGGKYSKEGEGKWSFFDEFFKKKELVAEMKKNPEFAEQFCRWVGEEKIPRGEMVRQLPEVIKNPDARKIIESGGKFDDAIKIVDATEPEQNSDFFKLLAKMRDACTNAAQVKEILRIRSDKVARDKVLGTYKSLVDFMKLADVDVPSE
jgi:hypothetical protein